MRRRLPIIFTVLLLTLAAGCKSNNADGRLVGRWVCSNPPKAPPGVTMTWVFSADKSISLILQGPGGSKTVTGQYRLGFGDAVYIDHLSEPLGGQNIVKDDITVNGSQMTARDPDGTTAVFSKQ